MTDHRRCTMTYRTFFWIVGFALPVAVVISISISLQCDHATLEAMIARQSAQQASMKSHRPVTGHKTNGTLKRKGFKLPISPLQKRFIAAFYAATGPATKGGSMAKNLFALMDQPSATQLYFPQLLGDPTYRNAVSALEKQQIEGRYGPLFAKLNLSPSSQGQLEDLLTEREMARDDAESVFLIASNQAYPTAIDPEILEAEIAAGSSNSAKAIGWEIFKRLGPHVAQTVLAFDGIAQFYNVTDEMETRLSDTSTPLQPAQSDQIIGMLTQALGAKVQTHYWAVPESVITKAPKVLSPPQISVLKQIQQEHAAERLNLTPTIASTSSMN
jgi:hypothetical protein